MRHDLYISLGSNLGDREKNLNDALRLLSERIGTLCECSAFHETRPWGFASPNLFLNAAAHFATDTADATQLLSVTQEVEKALGRASKSTGGAYADRIIDIDLLLLDNSVCDTPALTLPHPRLHLRRFVLEPLCEIAPGLQHPRLALTTRQLLDRLNIGCITHAKEADARTLAAINSLLPQLSTNAKPLTLDSLTALTENPLTRLYLISDEEGDIRAMATLCLTDSPTGRKAWVEDVVVDSTCRRRGYARQLLRHIEEEARTYGAKSVNLTSRPTRTAANQLYKATGYTLRDSNVYRKSLTPLTKDTPL